MILQEMNQARLDGEAGCFLADDDKKAANAGIANFILRTRGLFKEGAGFQFLDGVI